MELTANKVILIFIGIIVLSIYLGNIFVGVMMGDITRSYDFCKREGYDTTNIYGGIYSEYYGKVECVSSFKGERESKIFEVRENWRKRLVKK